MSSTTMAGSGATRQPYRAPEHRSTFAGLVRSEWIKFWSVRSSVVTMLIAVVAIIGVSALTAAASVWLADGSGEEIGSAGLALETSVAGAQAATLIVAAIGVVFMTSEFSTGMFRTSLTAAPRRLPVLWAKAVVLAITVMLVLGTAIFAAFFIGQGVLSTVNGSVSIGDADVLRILLGNIFVLAGIAVAGLGLGTLIRHTAGAICSFLALLLIAPVVLLTLPDFPGKQLITDYNFANSPTALTVALRDGAGNPSATASLIAFLAWVALFLAGGALALHRRDV